MICSFLGSGWWKQIVDWKLYSLVGIDFLIDDIGYGDFSGWS